MGSPSFFVLLICQDTVISLFLLSSFQFTQTVWTIEGKTATLCPCFHLVCSYSPLEVFGQWLISRFPSVFTGGILMEHFPKVLIIVLFVCLFCMFVGFSSIYGAFHCKQTSNAGGFCVHVVSQLVA